MRARPSRTDLPSLRVRALEQRSQPCGGHGSERPGHPEEEGEDDGESRLAQRPHPVGLWLMMMSTPATSARIAMSVPE